MSRNAFLRELRRYCRKNGLSFAWAPRTGKGSHGRVTVNGRFTTVQDGDFSPFRVKTLLAQLGLPAEAV
jgi:hypothetical protein